MKMTEKEFYGGVIKIVGKYLELQERIDKAIEYIEQKKLQPRLRTANTYSLQERQLLYILKGSDSNGK